MKVEKPFSCLTSLAVSESFINPTILFRASNGRVKPAKILPPCLYRALNEACLAPSSWLYRTSNILYKSLPNCRSLANWPTANCAVTSSIRSLGTVSPFLDKLPARPTASHRDTGNIFLASITLPPPVSI